MTSHTFKEEIAFSITTTQSTNVNNIVHFCLLESSLNYETLFLCEVIKNVHTSFTEFCCNNERQFSWKVRELSFLVFMFCTENFNVSKFGLFSLEEWQIFSITKRSRLHCFRKLIVKTDKILKLGCCGISTSFLRDTIVMLMKNVQWSDKEIEVPQRRTQKYKSTVQLQYCWRLN
jgi:hypothetical protein